jgi:hypothetical protein
VYVCPAIVSVAVRAAPVFAATVMVAVPEPVPLVGLTVAQVESLDAVQPQVERFAVTDTLLVAPAAAADNEPADSVREHTAEAWVTV